MNWYNLYHVPVHCHDLPYSERQLYCENNHEALWIPSNSSPFWQDDEAREAIQSMVRSLEDPVSSGRVAFWNTWLVTVTWQWLKWLKWLKWPLVTCVWLEPIAFYRAISPQSPSRLFPARRFGNFAKPWVGSASMRWHRHFAMHWLPLVAGICWDRETFDAWFHMVSSWAMYGFIRFISSFILQLTGRFGFCLWKLLHFWGPLASTKALTSASTWPYRLHGSTEELKEESAAILSKSQQYLIHIDVGLCSANRR